MHAVDTSALSPGVQRKLWTREEAARVAELFPGERYELIEGELIDKIGQKPPHATIISVLTSVFAAAFPRRIRSQLPMVLPDPDGQYSEPEPDLVVVCKDVTEFLTDHPSPLDIVLLIEVADTTFRFDRSTKYRLYARAGVQEYWIVDIPNERVVVCRSPQGEDYRSVTIFGEDETISPAAAPEKSFSVKQIFG